MISIDVAEPQVDTDVDLIADVTGQTVQRLVTA
jgi:hypothetical protein